MAQDAQELRQVLQSEPRKTAAKDLQRNPRQAPRSHLAEASSSREKHEGESKYLQQNAQLSPQLLN